MHGQPKFGVSGFCSFSRALSGVHCTDLQGTPAHVTCSNLRRFVVFLNKCVWLLNGQVAQESENAHLCAAHTIRVGTGCALELL